MRIIRVVSDKIATGQTAPSYFSKGTSAPIIVKPHAKIALKSISYELPQLPAAPGDDLVVVLENLGIDGYDFLTNQKSAIVAIVPSESLNVVGNGVSYIEPFPTFVNLNNEKSMNINNFYVSIKQGSDFIQITDRMYLQLLIED